MYQRKALAQKIPFLDRYEYTTTPSFPESFSEFCLDIMVSDAENPSWCSAYRYTKAWYTKIYPPMDCSEDECINEVRLRPFKQDSKWSTDTRSPGRVYDVLISKPVSGLIMGVEPFVDCMWDFTYLHDLHLGILHFPAPVKLGEANGRKWRNTCWTDCMFLWPNFWCNTRRSFWEGVKCLFSSEKNGRLISVGEDKEVAFEGKGNRKIWLRIIWNLKRRFTIQWEHRTLVTNSEGTSGSSTSTEKLLRVQ